MAATARSTAAFQLELCLAMVAPCSPAAFRSSPEVIGSALVIAPDQ